VLRVKRVHTLGNMGVSSVLCSEEIHGSTVLQKSKSGRQKDDVAKMPDDFTMHPVCQAAKDLNKNVDFVLLSTLPALPHPWPRNQDLPRSMVSIPSTNDLVLAVSHTWFYQRHPDPFGTESIITLDLARRAVAEHMSGEALLFYDYLSVTQRPFRKGQAERSELQQRYFEAALKAMPRLYILADAVLHVEPPAFSSPAHDDGEVYSVDCSRLYGATLAEFNSEVQIVGMRECESFGLFDRVLSVDGVAVKSVADVRKAMQSAELKRTPSFALLERAPFGPRNLSPASDRGWIYLERFCSMVKVAMVDESESHRVIFSNSEEILAQIRAGGKKLREAAMVGEEKLTEVLDSFLQELQHKVFCAVSTDAVGEGGRATVARIMKELVMDLPKHWSTQVLQQRQRQLASAVQWGDSQLVRSCLSLKVDPNFQDELGFSCLHSAAKGGHLAIVQALLEHGADVTMQDSRGQSPAHLMPLFASEETLKLFDLLVTPEVLECRSQAGVSVFDRFSYYSLTACDGKPFEGIRTRLKVASSTASPITRPPSVGRVLSDISQWSSTDEEEEDEMSWTYSSFLSSKGMRAHVWTPVSVKVRTSILCLSTPFLLPWALQKQFFDALASSVCREFKLNLVVLTHGSPPASSPGYRLSVYHAELLELIDEMPLREKFVLFDASNGINSALLWPLQERLLGAFLVHSAGVLSEEDRNSAAFKRISDMLLEKSQTLRQRNLEVVRECLSTWVMGEPAFLDSLVEKVQEAFSTSSHQSDQDCWDHSAATYEWMRRDITESLVDKAPLNLQVRLACPQHSPQLLCQESTHRLQSSLPCSRLFYIPESRGLWFVENPAAVLQELLLFLHDL